MYVHTDIRHLVGLQPEQLLLHQGGDAKVEYFQLVPRSEPNVSRMQICVVCRCRIMYEYTCHWTNVCK